MPGLFDQFSPVSKQAWKDKIEKDLKGKSYEELLHYTPDNIVIQPFYNHEDQQDLQVNIPNSKGWHVCTEILVEDEKEANHKILKVLNWGAAALLLYIEDTVNLNELLKGVKIDIIHLDWVIEGDTKTFLDALITYCQENQIDYNQLKGSINIDPLENIARTGNWRESKENDFKVLQEIQDMLPTAFAGYCINANLFQNAGATSAQQLGIALSMAHEYFLNEEKKNRNFWVNFSIGGSFFEEIAKLRAFRILWNHLNQQYDKNHSLHVYAESSLRNKTVYDAHNNLLRSTTEGMSAILGGAQTVNLKSFSDTYDQESENAQRLGINQQLIMAYESHLSKVSDPSDGAYFIDNLTKTLAEKGYAFFQEIESKGGYIAAMKSEFIQNALFASHESEIEKFDKKEVVLLGSNLYPNSQETADEKIKGHLLSHAVPTGEFAPITPSRLAEKSEIERLHLEHEA